MENQYSILQKEREKKQRRKSRLFTSLLCTILIILILFFNYTFFIAPYLEHVQKETQAMHKLQAKFTSDQIKTHDFNKKTYVVTTSEFVFIFDENGDLLNTKPIYDSVKVLEKAKIKKMINSTISAGFGYDEPAIVVEDEQNILLLDYDSYEIIYFGEKK